MTVINYDRALELLKKAIADKGDGYVYPRAMTEGCVYVIGGQPSCIVGHVIGYEMPKLIPIIEVWERKEAEHVYVDDGYEPDYSLYEGNPGNTSVIDLRASIGATEDLSLRFTPKAEKLLSRVQEFQDSGLTWGLSLQEAVDLLSKSPELADV